MDNANRTPMRGGRRVVVVSREPVVVEDSSPETRKSISFFILVSVFKLTVTSEPPSSPDYPRNEPATPTPAARSTGTATSEVLSYIETAHRAPYPDGPGAVFARIDRECDPSPRIPHPVLSPTRQTDPTLQSVDDPFVCPSPSVFGGSHPQAETASLEPPFSVAPRLPSTPRLSSRKQAKSAFSAPRPSPSSSRGWSPLRSSVSVPSDVSPSSPSFWSDWSADTFRSQTMRECKYINSYHDVR